MGTSPDRIRADIEATREKLAADLDRLADRASPRRMAHRRGERVRESAAGLRDRFGGTGSAGVDQAKEQGSRAADQSRHAARATRQSARQAGHTAGRTPGEAMRRTQGNPLAAGALAFGAGLAAASMAPRTEREQEAVGRYGDRAGRMAQPVRDAAMESVRHLKEDATDSARQAAGHLKESAGEAARDAKDQARPGGTGQGPR